MPQALLRATSHFLPPASYYTDDYLPRCSECSKLFRSERHLDLHLERKHDTLLQPNATVCLGE